MARPPDQGRRPTEVRAHVAAERRRESTALDQEARTRESGPSATVVTGRELDRMDDEQLRAAAVRVDVSARVSP